MRHQIWSVLDAIAIIFIVFSTVGGDQEAHKCFNVLLVEKDTIQEESKTINRHLAAGGPELDEDSLFSQSN